MIEQFGWAVVLAGGLVFIIFCFVEHALSKEKKGCEHITQTTFDSYHKKVCIDCGEEFSTTEIAK